MLFRGWTATVWVCVVATSVGAAKRDPSIDDGDSAARDLMLLSGSAIAGVQLVDARSNTVLTDLNDGDTINLKELGLPAKDPWLSAVLVLPSSDDDVEIKSVVFDLDGILNFFVDGIAPYSLCGDNRDNYFSCFARDFGLGSHTLTATPYPMYKGRGFPGEPYTISFTIVQGDDCPIPRFIGKWEPTTPYPLLVAEAQGAVLGDDLVIFSGFSGDWDKSTTATFARDTAKASSAKWRPMDDIPIPQGVTHGAFVVVDSTKFYACGGYQGGHPGPPIAECLIYDHSIAPGRSKQWSRLPSLPEARAGGGMIYDSVGNTLVFSGGAERYDGETYVDYRHTWLLNLDKLDDGWIEKQDLPFFSNHMSFVSVQAGGREYHFFAGGQLGGDELNGNIDYNYEWDVATETWIERSRMPLPRGHASASTRAFGCGFVMAGGSTNESGKTRDVSYYDVSTDSWFVIGNLPYGVNTPVCDIADGYMVCESGLLNTELSFQRKIALQLS